MKQKHLFLMCGIPGSGKSTWVRNQIAKTKYKCVHVSRDDVRFSMIKDDEEYFSHEDEVFAEFLRRIDVELNESDAEAIFVDATHLSEVARNKVLDGVHIPEGTKLYAVNFNMPLQTCLDQNELRKGVGRTYVPRSVIRRMYAQYQPPHENEKYHFDSILTVGIVDGEEENE